MTTDIKTLFQTAQTEYIKSIKKESTFHPTELDMQAPPADQLYPMPLFVGELNNTAVDRVCMSKKGIFTLTKNPNGTYQAPGGGMMVPLTEEEKASDNVPNIQLEKNIDKFLRQMLNEHLEEEHGSLYQTAKKQYNELPEDLFLTTLTACIDKMDTVKDKKEAHFSILLNIPGFKDNFLKKIHGVTISPNADRLAAAVAFLDAYKPSGKESGKQKKALDELRATLQLDTFKLHPLFKDAFEFIQAHSVTVDIRQVNDTRSGGGSQTARTFLMDSPLEDFFAEKGIEGRVLADDLTGGKYVYQDLFQIIANFESFKFSHVLTFAAAQIHCLNKGADFKEFYSQTHFEQARAALHAGGMKVLLINEMNGFVGVVKALPKSHFLKPLLIDFHAEMLSLAKSGKVKAEELIDHVEQTLAVINDPKLAKTYQQYVEGIQQGKASPQQLLICKIMLGIAAMVILLGATAVIAPVAATVAAVTAAACSYGFFEKGKQQGLSLAASKLAAEAAKTDIAPATATA